MKQSLRERIIDWMQRNPIWHNGGEVEKLAMNVGYKGSTASRELRQIYEDGLTEREERKGRFVRSVWYKIKI